MTQVLEALDDPSHERHCEFKEWLDDDFDPHVVDVDQLYEDVAYLAEPWPRRPPVKRRTA